IKKAALEKEKDQETEIFNLEQEIKKQWIKLDELLELDHQENQIIQELNQAKKELAQAEQELVIYQQKEIDLTKVAELRYSTIPVSMKLLIQRL
ncbi:16773_t:CDS:1, partial [Gigaspora rosea]